MALWWIGNKPLPKLNLTKISCNINDFTRTHFSYGELYATFFSWKHKDHVDGLVQDCSNSIANALELLQFCTEPSMLCYIFSWKQKDHVDGLVQDCSNSIADALELLQSCTEP